MKSLVVLLGVPQLRRNGILYGLTVAGVALGVAAVLTIQVINHSALASFEASVDAVSARSDLSVVAVAPRLPEDCLPQVLGHDGVRAAWPLHRVRATLGDVSEPGDSKRDVPARYVDLLGMDLSTPGRLPFSQEVRGEDVWATPGWAAITPELSGSLGVRVGESLSVVGAGKEVDLVVGALVDFDQIAPLASPNLIVMDIAQSQALFGEPGVLDRIDVVVRPGHAPAQVASTLQAQLGPAVEIQTADERGQQARGLLAAFRLNLTALSLVSLLVGVFLVHTSVHASLVRRRAELGILRSLGATSTQVLRVVLTEAALLGGLGTALGIPVGLAAAQANLSTVSQTLTNIYLLSAVEELSIPAWMFLLAIGIGVGGACLGALAPAREVSQAHPRKLLGQVGLHDRTRDAAPWLLGAAAALAVLVGLWFGIWGRGWAPAGFVLAVTVLAVLPLATPSTVAGVAKATRPHRMGLGHALQGLDAKLQTVSLSVAALAVAVAMLVSITLMVGSFRSTLGTWIDTTLQADVFLSTATSSRQGRTGVFDPATIDLIRRRGDVAYVDRQRRFRTQTGDRPIFVAGLDVHAPRLTERYALIEGRPDALSSALEAGQVMISEPLARKLGVSVGDSLPLLTPGGPEALPIAAVFYDYSTEAGVAYMTLQKLEALFGPGKPSTLAVYLEVGADPEAVAAELDRSLDIPGLSVRSNEALRRRVFEIFEQTFSITRILQAMGLVIAATGITLTLLIMARERSAEIALYRSLGASRNQMFGLYVAKGVSMGSLGLVLGASGGVALAGILIFLINRQYFGWTIHPSLPWPDLVLQAFTILAFSALAAVYPAAVASRTPASELSRDAL